jgi:adenine-specific DNA-methyltransferase
MNRSLNSNPSKITSTATGSKPTVVALQSPNEVLRRFPQTRYYGSKRKLLSWMYECIRPLRFETALDAFGGTGSVSLLLQAMRKTVTYNDALGFNCDSARVLLSPALPLTCEQLDEFMGGLRPVKGVVATNFAGIFFTDEENSWIDGYVNHIADYSDDPMVRALLKHLLYQACLRKRPFNLFHRANLSLRTRSDVKRSFGNLATWNKSFEDHIRSLYAELEAVERYPRGDFKVLPAGSADIIPAGHDLVYIDPPYISLESRYNNDDYWKKYHFLEGIHEYDRWEERIDDRSPIKIMDKPGCISKWSSKHLFLGQLDRMLCRHNSSTVVMSYVSSAYPDEETLMDLFKANFSMVTLHSAPYSHALSKSKKREILIIGREK